MENKKPEFNLDRFSSEKETKKEIKSQTKVETMDYPITNNEVSAPNIATTKNKKKIATIISLAVLFVLVVTTLTFLIIKKPEVETDIFINIEMGSLTNNNYDFTPINSNRIEKNELGEIVRIVAIPGDSFFATCNVSNVNANISGTIQPTSPAFLRFRVYATIVEGTGDNAIENYFGDIFTFSAIEEITQSVDSVKFSEDWSGSKDGYIYYNDIFRPNETIDLKLLVTFDEFKTNNNIQGNSIKIYFSFDALQPSEGQSSFEMWPTSPSSWKTLISNKYIEEYVNE